MPNPFGRFKPLFDLALVVVFEAAIAPVLVFSSFVARFARRTIDVGIGPDPLINNVFHKRALERQGYTVETFVRSVWHTTTEFDVRGDLRVRLGLIPYYLFFTVLARYRCIYIYFNGGPLAHTRFLGALEPWLLRLARVKVVVMPYGGDVAELSRTRNLLLRHGYSRDYPHHRFERAAIAARIDRWTTHASHVIGGCDWVDYLYHWDTLMVAHFSIDPERWRPEARPAEPGRALRLLHAPNHRTLKGTEFFVKAVEQLRAEGVAVELVIMQKVPNTEIQRIMATVDVIADQLVVGWYAMFALEGMMMEKPVLCYLREDLEELYVTTGLVERGEIPIINCSPTTVKESILWLVNNMDKIPGIGRRSREYAIKHHSIESIGKVFHSINLSIGLAPSGVPPRPAPASVTAPASEGPCA